MFDLEQSITHWREEMLAAGIQPASLEELESHLREEITRQMSSGADEPEAYRLATLKIGPPDQLTAEFKRASHPLGWLAKNPPMLLNGILCVFWLVYCGGGFFRFGLTFWRGTSPAGYRTPMDHYVYFALALLLEFIYLRGAIASVLSLGGNLRERRILWLIAIYEIIGALNIVERKSHLSSLTIAFTLLALVSLWFLRPSRKPLPATH